MYRVTCSFCHRLEQASEFVDPMHYWTLVLYVANVWTLIWRQAAHYKHSWDVKPCFSKYMRESIGGPAISLEKPQGFEGLNKSASQF